MKIWTYIQTNIIKLFMKLWTCIEIAIGAIGGALGYFLGGFDGLIQALLIFTVIDYITGLFNAAMQKNVSSSIGFRGIIKKVLMFVIVGMGSIIDMHLLSLGDGSTTIIRNSIICFFLANEGISILENAALAGVPVPEKLRDILLQLRDKESKKTKKK